MTTPGLVDLVKRQLEIASLTGEIDSVMHAIVDEARVSLGGDGAALTLPEGDRLRFTVAVGVSTPLLNSTVPIDGSVGGRCLVERTPLLIDDLLAEPTAESAQVRALGNGSLVLAPLIRGERTLGVLSVYCSRRGAFTDESLAALALIARSAAIALRHADVVARLGSAEQASRALVEQAADALLVLDGDGSVLAGNDAATSLLWYSREELQGLNIADLFSAEELAARPLRLDLLRGRGELRGERPYRRKDGTFIQIEHASRTLDDGRIHISLRDVTQRNRNETRLRESLLRLREIVDMQREIAELELDPEAVTGAILERTQRLTGADGAGVIWLGPDTAIWRHASGAATACLGMRLDRRASLTGLAASTLETYYAPDTDVDPRVDRNAVKRSGFRSVVATPLQLAGKPVAVLTVCSKAPHAFDELAVETTRLMAEFVGAALRNSQVLETRLQLADELRMQGEIVEHMQTALYVWALGADNVFRLEYANAASERETGVAVADVLGRRLDELEPRPTETEEGFRRILAGELAEPGEPDHGDGREPETVFSARAFRLGPARVAVTFENITERVRHSRALAESEERFRAAFDSGATGMVLMDVDGTFIRVNDRLAVMFDLTHEELLAAGIQGLTHPDDVAATVALSERMTRGELDRFELEKRYLRKDGSVMWGHVSVALIRDYEGKPLHRIAHVLDVSKRHEAEQLFASVFEVSIVPKMILDDERNVVDLNLATASLLGVSREEALGLSLDDLLPGQPVARQWRRFMEAGVAEGETTVHRPDGGQRLIEFAANSNVHPGRHIVVMRDLTRQKSLEIQLRQAQRMEAVGRLAGGIAHDFNNLLTAISGYSEFLTASIAEPKLRQHAEEIGKAASRAAALTGQLLAFSRRQVMQPRLLDLNDVVTGMEMMLRRLLGEDVELSTILEPELGAVRADPNQLEQVIVSLAMNARDAMPRGGSAVIRTANVDRPEGSFVELSVTDTGVGMNERERQHLFDPFFTTKAGGIGLGLATVYGIVEQSGGRIDVQSETGAGSSFRIHLRREAWEQHAEPGKPAEAPDGGTETILLVEDEQVVRNLVAEILETSGYTVLQATDGPSALELVRRHSGPIDLLVTDVVMPGMSGPDVAKAVGSMRPGTQVLYTSGYTDSAIDRHGVLEPGIAFLQKPFSAADLTRKVRALVEKPAAEVA